MIKLKWIATAKDEAARDPTVRGNWRSIEGRFEISPNYNHSIYPSGYTINDRYDATGIRSYDTVRDCKMWATERVARELKEVTA